MREQALAAERFAGPATPHRPAPAGLGVTQIAVAHVYGVPLDQLLAATRKHRRAAEARQVAMYLAHVGLGMNLSAVARGFGRDRSTACHACRHVEELREDPEIDRRLTWLEALIRGEAGAGAVR